MICANVSASLYHDFPAEAGRRRASQVGTLTGPASRSTRLASALRLCSFAPPCGAPITRNISTIGSL